MYGVDLIEIASGLAIADDHTDWRVDFAYDFRIHVGFGIDAESLTICLHTNLPFSSFPRTGVVRGSNYKVRHKQVLIAEMNRIMGHVTYAN